MRLEFDLPGLESRLPALEAGMAPLAKDLQLNFSFTRADRLKNVALFGGLILAVGTLASRGTGDACRPLPWASFVPMEGAVVS